VEGHDAFPRRGARDRVVPPPAHPERGDRGGAVERLRRRRPPVDQRALAVGGVGQPDAPHPGRRGAPDPAVRVLGGVEPPEAQPRAGRGQRPCPVRPALHRDVALPAGAQLLPGALGGRAAGEPVGVGQLRVEQGVQPEQVPGLLGELRRVPGVGGRRGLPHRAIIKVQVHVLVF
jgi:hypothetical protein